MIPAASYSWIMLSYSRDMSGQGCSKQGWNNPGLVQISIQIWKLKKQIQFDSLCPQFDNLIL